MKKAAKKSKQRKLPKPQAKKTPTKYNRTLLAWLAPARSAIQETLLDLYLYIREEAAELIRSISRLLSTWLGRAFPYGVQLSSLTPTVSQKSFCQM